MPISIIVTDVTEMHSNMYCVAGWDQAAGRMVRPLPGGSNWPASAIGPDLITPGASLVVALTGAANSSYPHRTEDTPVDVRNWQVGVRDQGEWLRRVASSASPTLSAMFDGQVVRRTYRDFGIMFMSLPANVAVRLGQ